MAQKAWGLILGSGKYLGKRNGFAHAMIFLPGNPWDRELSRLKCESKVVHYFRQMNRYGSSIVNGQKQGARRPD